MWTRMLKDFNMAEWYLLRHCFSIYVTQDSCAVSHAAINTKLNIVYMPLTIDKKGKRMLERERERETSMEANSLRMFF